MQIVLAFILIAVPAVLSVGNSYCRLAQCPGGTHTCCKFPFDKGATAECGNSNVRGLDGEEVNLLLQAFNYQLVWDEELRMIAQRWADQCHYLGTTCSHVSRFYVRERRKYITADSPADNLHFSPLFQDWAGEDYHLWQNENRVGCGSVRMVDQYYVDAALVVCYFGTE